MAQQQIWQWSTRTTLLASGSEKVFYDVLKRSMDILLATALIILLLPLLLLIALLIKLDSPGPVIFTQERDRKSTRLNSSHVAISYAVFCLKNKTCMP